MQRVRSLYLLVALAGALAGGAALTPHSALAWEGSIADEATSAVPEEPLVVEAADASDAMVAYGSYNPLDPCAEETADTDVAASLPEAVADTFDAPASDVPDPDDATAEEALQLETRPAGLTPLAPQDGDAEDIDELPSSEQASEAEPAKDGWIEERDATYFYREGEPLTGELNWEGSWYWLDPQAGGARTNGFVVIPTQTGSNKTCFYDQGGRMVFGQQHLDQYWYHFDEQTGAMTTGFFDIPNQKKRVYYDQKGRMLYGEQPLDGLWYHFDEQTGAMSTGFVDIPGKKKRVCYDEAGHMRYGEQCLGGQWYHFDEQTGAMTRGFLYLGAQKKWVCYDEQGRMLHGQQWTNQHWYYFDPATGAVTYGFVHHPSQRKWVFYDRTMGWMLYGEQFIDQGWYLLHRQTGAVCYGWQQLDGGKRQVYYDTVTGRMYHGVYVMGNRLEFFDQLTGARKYHTQSAADVAARRFFDAIYRTPYAGDGYCALWVTNAYRNAGARYPTGDARDMVNAWWCSGTNLSHIEPGMVIGVRRSFSALGSIYGHVGIYLGEGMVMHNSAHFSPETPQGLALTPLDEWIEYYRNDCPVRFGWPDGSRPY